MCNQFFSKIICWGTNLRTANHEQICQWCILSLGLHQSRSFIRASLPGLVRYIPTTIQSSTRRSLWGSFKKLQSLQISLFLGYGNLCKNGNTMTLIQGCLFWELFIWNEILSEHDSIVNTVSLQPGIYLDVNALGQTNINVYVFVQNENQEEYN